MARVLKYFVRGRADDAVAYKISKGKIVRLGATRDEDLHDTVFDAIYYAAQALKRAASVPSGVRFDVEHREVEECPL